MLLISLFPGWKDLSRSTAPVHGVYVYHSLISTHMSTVPRSLTSSAHSFAWDPTGINGDPVRALSMDRAREQLGFKPKTTLDDGVGKTIKYHLENRPLADRKRKALYG